MELYELALATVYLIGIAVLISNVNGLVLSRSHMTVYLLLWPLITVAVLLIKLRDAIRKKLELEEDTLDVVPTLRALREREQAGLITKLTTTKDEQWERNLKDVYSNNRHMAVRKQIKKVRDHKDTGVQRRCQCGWWARLRCKTFRR